MKRLTLLSLILIGSLLLGACKTVGEEAGPSEQEPAEADLNDLGGAEIRVGVENAYPPFNYIDEATNEPGGWDYDAVRAICDLINCTPVFVEAAWEGIFEATAAGEYDVVADGVTITAERDEVVDFSIPYMVIAQYIVVRADETEIVNEASLIASDVIVGTQIGTTNEAKAIEMVGEDRVQSYDTFDLPIQALISGDVGAVIMDEEAAKGFVEQNPDMISVEPRSASAWKTPTRPSTTSMRTPTRQAAGITMRLKPSAK
ncbi:MAG: transporter substrate-binding domain-containing protein [Anaerolineales bacterium]